MLYKDAVNLILESIGRKEEIDFYLNKFRSANSPYFCILVPDLYTVDNFWESFLFSMETLHKLELLPVIFIGGVWEDEHRAKFSRYDFFRITGEISAKEEAKKIPVIFQKEMFLRYYENHYEILPRRIHFVRSSCCLHDNEKQTVFQIEPYRMEDGKIGFHEENSLVQEQDAGIYLAGSYLLNRFPDLHISVTSSFLLLKELFTVKGAGTLFRKRTKIVHISKKELTEEILKKAKDIIEASFKKKVKEERLSGITDLFFDENMQSVVALEKMESGYYLSKFAVSIELRGKGVAQDLWQHLENLNIPLFWKTYHTNSIRKWYEKISDGNLKVPGFPYVIFWKNLPYQVIPRIVAYLIERGSDFYEESP